MPDLETAEEFALRLFDDEYERRGMGGVERAIRDRDAAVRAEAFDRVKAAGRAMIEDLDNVSLLEFLEDYFDYHDTRR